MIATPSVRSTAASLHFPLATELDELDPELDTLIVIGGGKLIDSAKFWRRTEAPDKRLVIIPSLWGSGAEASPVAVFDRNGKKDIHVDQALLPDIRCIWPELARSIPKSRARDACGDAWAHALEGWLSPLANGDLHAELAGIIAQMLQLPLAANPGWFEVSAKACAGQARASVGLVHGIAHVLEGPLREEFPGSDWGHARLCAVFLWPVMEFNRAHSDKLKRLCTQFGLDEDAIFQVLRELHRPDAFDEALPLLEQHWMTICRDACSRTNSALVRPGSKEFFTKRAFL